MRPAEFAIGLVFTLGGVGLLLLGGLGGHWLAGLAVFFAAMLIGAKLHQNDQSPDRKGRD